MRNLIIILLVFSCFSSKANIRDSIPNGSAFNIFHGWVESITQFVGDSGLATKLNDTTAKPKAGYGMLKFFTDHKPYYWDGIGWRAFAAPLTNFVKYSDSTVTFVTPKQQKDSLAHYVNTFAFQTIAPAKEWQGTQTFDASIIQNFKGNDVDRHQLLDSLNNITSASTNIFVNSFRNINYNYHSGGALPGAVGVTNNLLLDDIADTLGNLLSSQGAFNAQIAFRGRNGTSASVFSVTNFNKNGMLIASSVGATILTDSSFITDPSKTWNIHVNMVGYYSHADLPIHGTADSYTDINIGATSLLDSTGNDYTLTARNGMIIGNLANSHTVHTKAIDQLGLSDTVRFKSGLIYTPNLPNTTTAYTLYYNPATGLITYDNAPTAFNNNPNIQLASYRNNSYQQLFNEMLKSKVIKVVKKKHKTVITIE